MAKPASPEGQRAAQVLRIARAVQGRPEPTRAERRAEARAAKRAKR